MDEQLRTYLEDLYNRGREHDAAKIDRLERLRKRGARHGSAAGAVGARCSSSGIPASRHLALGGIYSE
ncbi:MAG TPA: hypothetical protein VIJ39_14390 [Solirubrobacteraceae bacterium]